MRESPSDWSRRPLIESALPGKAGFDDGDWIEAPHITESGIRLVQTGNIGIGEFLDKSNNQKFISAASFKLLRCKWVHPGDILICRLADPIGRACRVPPTAGECITSVDCTIYRPDPQKADGGFILHVLNSSSQLKAAENVAGGSTRQRISRGHLGRLDVALPPVSEQRRIAEVLDTVDDVIQKTELLIAKLKQMKQGLLHDLLTRGVADNGELRDPERHREQFKDSSLGRIPKAWEVGGIADLAENLDGRRVPLKAAARQLRSGIFPYYGASGIIDWIDDYLFDGDFVLLGEDGENVVSRNLPLAFRVTGKFWVNNHAHIYQPLDGVDVRFLEERLEAVDYSSFTSGSAQPKLTQAALAHVRFPIPPPSEQRVIADILGSHTQRLIHEREALAKLRLLKGGLMEDLLTGRVRTTVLEAAA